MWERRSLKMFVDTQVDRAVMHFGCNLKVQGWTCKSGADEITKGLN